MKNDRGEMYPTQYILSPSYILWDNSQCIIYLGLCTFIIWYIVRMYAQRKVSLNLNLMNKWNNFLMNLILEKRKLDENKCISASVYLKVKEQ